MIAEVSINRTSLSLTPLVIRNDGYTGSLWIGDIDPVNFDYRREYAPDSRIFPGSALLSAVAEASVIPLTIYAQGTSTATKNTAIAELEAALSQFTYAVTVTIDGASTTYNGEPNLPQWSWDEGMAESFLARASVVIPVNPPGA